MMTQTSIPRITFNEFIEVCKKDFNCEYEFTTRRVNNYEMPIRFLRRRVGGQSVTVSVKKERTKRMSPDVLRSVCAKLYIDPRKLPQC